MSWILPDILVLRCHDSSGQKGSRIHPVQLWHKWLSVGHCYCSQSRRDLLLFHRKYPSQSENTNWTGSTNEHQLAVSICTAIIWFSSRSLSHVYTTLNLHVHMHVCINTYCTQKQLRIMLHICCMHTQVVCCLGFYTFLSVLSVSLRRFTSFRYTSIFLSLNKTVSSRRLGNISQLHNAALLLLIKTQILFFLLNLVWQTVFIMVWHWKYQPTNLTILLLAFYSVEFWETYTWVFVFCYFILLFHFI